MSWREIKTSQSVHCSEKFEKKVDLWKRNLLDLTNRNPQLNYKQGSPRSVEIKHPESHLIFKKILIDLNTLEFTKVFKKKSKKEIDDLKEEEKEEYLKSVPFLHNKAIERKLIKLKIKDIITNQEDKELEKRLKNFHRRELSSIQEKGVNILYICFGLLKWFDIGKKDPNYSPLIFIPVDISRKNILSNYKIKIRDEIFLTNISLKEKFSEVFQIKLPDFNEDYSESSLYDYFKKFQHIISKRKEWEIQDRCFVGLFSFSKISLFQDLKNYPVKLYNHRIVRAIAEGGSFLTSQNVPKKKNLGDNINPIENYSVLDSDSSQDTVIQYAKCGVSMVVRGPPGTGKSQTISNIIAECLAQGKKILFVAEKMAALNIVKKRLDDHGLGEFCLEVHSHKSNKYRVLDQIRSSLSKNLVKQNIALATKLKSLEKTRNKLNNYVDEINIQRGGANESLFKQIGRYSRMNEIPLIKSRINNVLNLTGDEIFEIKDKFSELEKYKKYLYGLGHSTFIDFNFNSYENIDEDYIFNFLEELLDLSYEFISIFEKYDFQEKFYNINNIENYNELKEFFDNYTISSILIDIKSKQSEYQNKFSSKIRYFKPTYYGFRKEILLYSNTKKKVDEILNEIESLHDKFLIPNLKYDCDKLFREINEINTKFEFFYQKWSSISSVLDLVKSPFEGKNIDELISSLEIITDKIEEFTSWISYNYLVEFISNKIGKAFIKKLRESEYPEILFEDLFEKSYYIAWIRNATSESSEIKNFDDKHHERSIKKFIDLDNESISLNQYRISEILFDSRDQNSIMVESVATSEMGYLNRELQKKRKIMPLRKLFTLTRHYLTSIKPCFLMSPLSVSNYLPGNNFDGFFDVVIFDEASQITPEDAIGSILRAKQLVVVGDQKQMPPSNFFKVAMAEELEDDENYSLESILDECVGIGLPELSLNWHYRSKKEGLIQFSNFHYYENNLVTFPDLLKEPDVNSDDIELLPAVDFIYVKDGIYDKGKTRRNKREAEEVAKGIIQHYLNNKTNGTDYSLGVVAFSEAQSQAVEEELEKLYRLNPEYEEIVNDPEINKETLFIKNLENVQGDERDFIFFSVCYGRDIRGKMTLNFGPINRVGGERRLNVMITRARYHVKAYCSFNPSEIDTSKSNSIGFKHMIQYLSFTKTKKLPDLIRSNNSSQLLLDSPFEGDVVSELRNRGYTVDTQVGAADYRIDIAIINPDIPAKYILGIECDGTSYQSSNTARDRDRIRKQVLNNLGWEFYHIWSPTWYENKERVLKNIDSMIERIKNNSFEKLMKKKVQNNKGNESANNSIQYEENGWKPDKISKKIKHEPKYRKKLLTIDNVIEYTAFTRKDINFKDYIYDNNSRNSVIQTILDHEGPIHREILEDRLAGYFGFKRKSPNLKNFLRTVLPNEFYYPNNTFYENKLRIFINPSDDKRKTHQLFEYEIKNSFLIVLKEIKCIEKKELFQQSASLFGAKTLNKTLENRMEESFQFLLNDLIVMEDQIVRMK